MNIGGPKDRYGGIGRNGALKTPEALAPGTLQQVGDNYGFPAQHVSNLQADHYIKGLYAAKRGSRPRSGVGV
jgi:hypothetical protein